MMTVYAVIPHDRAMQLRDVLTAGEGMQIVDVLRHDAQTTSGFLQLRHKAVSSVGPGVRIKHAAAVEAVKLFRIRLKKMMADDFLRRVIILLLIQSVNAAEVRNSAFRGCARAGKKDDALPSIQDFLQRLNLFFHTCNSPFSDFSCVPDLFQLLLCFLFRLSFIGRRSTSLFPVIGKISREPASILSRFDRCVIIKIKKGCLCARWF